jgi:allantoin racemase
MKLLLINPNATASMTQGMRFAAEKVLSPGTELMALTAEYGPVSIEGYYDEAFSIPPMLELIRAHQGEISGVVVGCFDDTGVDAARTLVDVPVVGICQAAMQAATVLAGSFSVITTLGRSVPALEHLALKYGFERSCRRVRACEVPVLALESDEGWAGDAIRREVELALTDDGAEAIVLGCAGMVDLASKLSAEFGVPVIDGVTTAVKLVEGLASLGLMTSGRGGYARPSAKSYLGEFSKHAPSDG